MLLRHEKILVVRNNQNTPFEREIMFLSVTQEEAIKSSSFGPKKQITILGMNV